jgi:hypothetical protein
MKKEKEKKKKIYVVLRTLHELVEVEACSMKDVKNGDYEAINAALPDLKNEQYMGLAKNYFNTDMEY